MSRQNRGEIKILLGSVLSHPTRYCIFTMQYNSNDALLTFDYGAMLIAGILRMQEALAEEERSASYASF